MDVVDAYNDALVKANRDLFDAKGVTTFENNSEEHTLWLSFFDRHMGDNLMRRDGPGMGKPVVF